MPGLFLNNSFMTILFELLQMPFLMMIEDFYF